MFHDSLGSVQLWRDFPELLAEATKREVIAYDRLGFGKSDPQEDEAEVFFPIIKKHFGFKKFIAFGHSVGGAMAISCARQFPKGCEFIITEATQAFVEDRTIAGIKAADKNFKNPEQVARLAKYHGDKAPWILRAWINVWLSKEFADWSLKEELSKIECPILTIHGDKDEYGSLKFPERIATWANSSSQQLILSDCGHVPHKEKTDTILKAVNTFIN